MCFVELIVSWLGISYNSGQEQAINAHIPTEFASELEKTCDQQDSQSFPLVVVVEWSRNVSQQENKKINSCDIVSKCERPVEPIQLQFIWDSSIFGSENPKFKYIFRVQNNF
jgi:hypothetical protein